ncbi:hypothetical protein SKAU_G00391900 [Synaphobranchus kaupii]|uniref:Uncharacterized protein n=1 Tax=Synaphobranchus kaupii TaxID=118154 RepID=A0A9Q1IBP1_SYNKA|nr:hypothetical protein SKAU_G00391900 [Synaphobranchus kaupii]
MRIILDQWEELEMKSGFLHLMDLDLERKMQGPYGPLADHHVRLVETETLTWEQAQIQSLRDLHLALMMTIGVTGLPGGPGFGQQGEEPGQGVRQRGGRRKRPQGQARPEKPKRRNPGGRRIKPFKGKRLNPEDMEQRQFFPIFTVAPETVNELEKEEQKDF